MKNRTNSLTKSVFYVLAGVVILVFAFLNVENIFNILSKIISVLMPIIIGLCLAYIVSPLYNVIVDFIDNNEKIKSIKFYNGFFKTLGIIICIFTLVIIIVGFVMLVIPELYNSLNSFLDALPIYQTKALSIIETLPFVKENNLLQGETLNYLNQIYEFLQSFITVFFNNVIKNIYVGVVSTVNWFFNFFLGIIIMVYVLIKKEALICQFRKIIYAIFDRQKADKIYTELRFANDVFKNFFLGKLLDSFIILIISYIIFSIMKLPYIVLLAVVIGITNIIPFFGPIFGAISTAILVFLVSPYQLIPFLIATFVIQQFDGNILGPKILGDKTGLDNFQVLCSTIVFGGLFGFVGMIIAVPIWAILARLINQSLVYTLKEKKLPTDSKSYKRIPPK